MSKRQYTEKKESNEDKRLREKSREDIQTDKQKEQKKYKKKTEIGFGKKYTIKLIQIMKVTLHLIRRCLKNIWLALKKERN